MKRTLTHRIRENTKTRRLPGTLVLPRALSIAAAALLLAGALEMAVGARGPVYGGVATFLLANAMISPTRAGRARLWVQLFASVVLGLCPVGFLLIPDGWWISPAVDWLALATAFGVFIASAWQLEVIDRAIRRQLILQWNAAERARHALNLIVIESRTRSAHARPSATAKRRRP